jgi:hypothetical protein
MAHSEYWEQLLLSLVYTWCYGAKKVINNITSSPKRNLFGLMMSCRNARHKEKPQKGMSLEGLFLPKEILKASERKNKSSGTY